MAINASHIVQINPRLLEPGGRDLEFNGLILTKNNTIPTGDSLVLPFGDPDSVGDYLGLESDEFRLASIYFMGYTNSFRKPRALYIARRLDADAAPFIRGGAISQTVAQLRTIADGTLDLTLGTHTGSLTGINFSTISSFSDAATILQTAIHTNEEGGADWTGATVTYSSLFRAFTITGGQAGEDLVVDYATGTVADALNLTRAGGAILSEGASALTEDEQMEAVIGITSNWVTFTTAWKATVDEMVAFGRWATRQGVNYLYTPWDDDPALLQANNTTTTAYALKEAEIGATAMWWKSADYAAFMMGVAASIDWDRTAGTITFAFKRQQGLAASVNRLADALALETQGVNYLGNFATRNDQFILSYQGEQFGDWRWIDTYVNGIWFFNALQLACMVGFEQTPRVPYTEAGYALIRSWLQDPINRALNNGVITPGMALSESQKAQINREAGLNISSNVQQEGYFVQIKDPPGATRVVRGSPIVNLWYTDAGSVHKLVVAATALT